MCRMLGALLVASLAGAREGADEALLDWESSYWRYHLTYRLPQFNAPMQDRKGRSADVLSYERGWHLPPMQGRITSADAPTDWMNPEFDDSSWPRERRPQAGSEQ